MDTAMIQSVNSGLMISIIGMGVVMCFLVLMMYVMKFTEKVMKKLKLKVDFDKVLYIRAYDGKENGISGSIRVTADFEKRIPVYTVNSRIDVPSAAHSITVHAPYTKQTNTKGGYTRATVVSGDKTYVRVINLADGETAELFDMSAGWYEVTVTDGKYSSVSPRVPTITSTPIKA